jgi:hypothetical protein
MFRDRAPAGTQQGLQLLALLPAQLHLGRRSHDHAPCHLPRARAKLLALLGERSTSGGAAVRVLASWEVTTEAVALCATAS